MFFFELPHIITGVAKLFDPRAELATAWPLDG